MTEGAAATNKPLSRGPPSTTLHLAPGPRRTYEEADGSSIVLGRCAMKKFMVLYKASPAAFAQAMKSTPEQQKAGMDAWMAWGKKAAAAIVDMGAPLGKAVRVTPAGASPVVNDLGGYSIMQAESKEALAETMKGHPHFMMADSSIEITELMPMPGSG
jgi:hypothetical protein